MKTLYRFLRRIIEQPLFSPNADTELYCAECSKRIRKGRTYLTANDEFHLRIEFCSEKCLRGYYDVKEEKA